MKFLTKIKLFLAFAVIIFIMIKFPQLTGLVIDNLGIDTDRALPVPEEAATPPTVYFSPNTNITEIFLQYIEDTKSTLYCALYDIGETVEQKLIEKSKTADVRVVKDDETREIALKNVKEDGRGLMHNKFCIRDNYAVWTGSYNPTARGSLNNNNALIIYSNHLSKLYNEEFGEFWSQKFKLGERSKQPSVKINSHLYTVYFCPEDECAEKLYNTLIDAEKSIKFMTFSFTRTDYRDLLIEKSRRMPVSGIFEKTRINQGYEIYKYLNDTKTDNPELQLDLKLDENKYNFHHKVFIIDDELVATGSFNPSKNADMYNDENLILITDPVIVTRYLEEFDRLFS
ncbi:hypothetical protein KY325_04940 [Candidatus Woesearchaeota archaeon]|nr:hypothetical protein [Candidatus Woesearchaeota archaeon]MBW3018480.1 hypothetical protein [Candidatus Woesearchaeota archaeon]